MLSLGPFESSPHIAVACSGGPDSLALTLLANDWARGVGGRVTALVVDHAMRRESAAEATSVCDRLSEAGIEAVTLTRQGPALTSDRQAAARHARYGLMSQWCREARVLHLLLGHHRGDQAETLMLRLGRGSGVDGLASMAAISEGPDVRLLRPLLDVSRESLIDFLQVRGTAWVVDPSNEDNSFARVRMRGLLPDLEKEGITEPRLAATARRMARARAALDCAATDLLARAVAIYPEGFALFSPDKLLAAPEDTGMRALSRLLACIGGSPHGPRMDDLERLYEWLSKGKGGGRTLGGCRLTRSRGGRILVCRESAAVAEPAPAVSGYLWDGRFRISSVESPNVMVGGLGPSGWAQIRADKPDIDEKGLPADARIALPAIWRLEEVVKVPHLLYCATSLGKGAGNELKLTFLPARLLGPARFAAVPALA